MSRLFDTHSPVARITIIRVLVALASVHTLLIHQTGIKNVFLHSDLEEEIYMQYPGGFIVKGQV